MLVNMCYYGALYEKTKKNSEVYETNATNLKELYSELLEKYAFDLSIDEILIAVNSGYLDNLDYTISSNDLITLLPPMSGG